MAWPIIASTATTLAAFVPHLWPGMIGEFMQYLPITLIIVLGSSLFVALVINPVLLAVLMKVENEKSSNKKFLRSFILLASLGILFVVLGINTLGNLFLIIAGLILLNRFVLYPGTLWFQHKLLPKIEAVYQNFFGCSKKGLFG